MARKSHAGNHVPKRSALDLLSHESTILPLKSAISNAADYQARVGVGVGVAFNSLHGPRPSARTSSYSTARFARTCSNLVCFG